MQISDAGLYPLNNPEFKKQTTIQTRIILSHNGNFLQAKTIRRKLLAFWTIILDRKYLKSTKLRSINSLESVTIHIHALLPKDQIFF